MSGEHDTQVTAAFWKRLLSEDKALAFSEFIRKAENLLGVSRATAARNLSRAVRDGEIVKGRDGKYYLAAAAPEPPETVVRIDAIETKDLRGHGVDRGERAGDRGDRGAVELSHGAQRGAAANLGGVGSEA